MNKPMIRLCPVCGAAPKVQVWQFEGQTIGARIFCSRTACDLPFYAEGDTLEDATKRWNEFTVEVSDCMTLTTYLRNKYLERMKDEEKENEEDV